MSKEKTIIFLTSSRPLGRSSYIALRDGLSKLSEEWNVKFVILPYATSVVAKKELRKILKGLLDG